jgi:hypothetical protein
MVGDSTALATLQLIVFGPGMLAGLLGRGRWSTVVIQTPVPSQPQQSSTGVALALLLVIVAWLYIAPALG